MRYTTVYDNTHTHLSLHVHVYRVNMDILISLGLNVLLLNGVFAVPQPPTWPELYKVCCHCGYINVSSFHANERDKIKFCVLAKVYYLRTIYS